MIITSFANSYILLITIAINSEGICPSSRSFTCICRHRKTSQTKHIFFVYEIPYVAFLSKQFWLWDKYFPKSAKFFFNNLMLNFRFASSIGLFLSLCILYSSQYNNTCVYVKYSTDSSDVAWTTDTCATKRNFVCKKAEGEYFD